MKLTDVELREIYRSIILPFGHPDPIGYVTRALATSGGDPSFVDGEGRMGFIPISPDRAAQVLGQQVDVFSLQGNLMVTMTMDMQFYQRYGSIDQMINATHFGDAMDMNVQFIDLINKNRPKTAEVVEPPRATLKDVVNSLMIRMKTPKANVVVKKLIDEMVN